jgi:peptidoglycan hydrolase-like protein with peptidoglycan-binding domain
VLRDWYEQGSPASRQGLVQRSLANQGYLPGTSGPLPVNDPQLRTAISRFQADNNMVVTGALDFVTYERALRNYVTLDENGNMTQVGWGPKGELRMAAANAPLRIDMQVENPVPDRSRFESGTQIFLSARVNRAAYFYCFMSDQQGNVIRLLPNAANPNALISAGNSVRIPDWMAPNPGFVLDTGAPGTESVGCFATEEDMLGRLPAVVATPALTLVQDVQGLAGIQAEFARASGPSPFAAQSVQWQVLPRSTPSTSQSQAPTPPAEPAPRSKKPAKRAAR